MKIFRNLAIIFGCLAVAVFAVPQYTNPSNPNYGTNKIGQCYAGSLNNWVGIANTSANLTNYAIQCDAQGNLVAPVAYLPLAGGTMTGPLGNTGWTQAEPLYPNASQQLTSSPAYLDCSQFTGADDGIKLQACMVALYALNHQSGVADARGMTGGTWSVNPFAASSIPTSGTLLMPAGKVTTLYGPVVAAMNWKIQGMTPNANTGVNYGIGGIATGSVLFAGTSFPVTYTTGTVTMGTVGQSEIVTGSSTSWADNRTTHTGTDIAVGCAFVSPAGGHTDNMTYGIIHSITDSTHIVLGWGVNEGTGAPGGSTYDIICPVYVAGDGYNTTDNAGFQYGMAAQDIAFDANNKAGVYPYVNWYGGQHTYVRDVAMYNFCGVGMAVEGTYAENSGPYENIGLYPGTCGTTGTIGAWFQSPSGVMTIRDISVNKGISSSVPAVGVELNGTGISISHVNAESVTKGVSMNDNIFCVPACAWRGGGLEGASNDMSIDTVNGGATTAVNIGSNINTPHDVIVHNITWGGSSTNILVDAGNSCTFVGSSVNNFGMYVLDDNGNVAVNTSYTQGGVCRPSVVNGSTPMRDLSRQVLVSNMTAVSTAGVNIGSTGTSNTTFSWLVTAANWYDLKCTLPVTFVSSATIKFQLVSISGSVTISNVNSETNGNTAASAAFQTLDTIAGTTLATSATPVTGAPGNVSETITYDSQFLTSHAGNIGLEFVGNGANNVQMLLGGECGLTQIN